MRYGYQMQNTIIDSKQTPFIDDNGNLYYRVDVDETEGRMKYRLQLFLTYVGTTKYHLKPNMAALRPNAGGQPYFLVDNINITPPEKENKRFVIPFLIQGIRGFLQSITYIPYISEWQVEFIANGEILATGYLSASRLYLKAPNNPKEITLMKKEGEKNRKTRKLYLERKFKKFDKNKLSKAEINVLEDIRRQWKSSNSDAVKKLLLMGYIHKRGILSSKYTLTEDGEDLLNWILHEY